MKTHLHDEQFDNHLHAACGRTDGVSPNDLRARFFVEDLEKVPRADRCRRCARYGGEPA